MTAEYRIDVYAPWDNFSPATSGAFRATIVDFRELVFTRRVNEPGEVRFSVRGDHPAIPYLVNKAIVKIYRRYLALGIDWTLELTAILRSYSWEQPEELVFSCVCPGILSMLGWRYVMWYAGTANRSVFINVPAETAFKTLVNYNAGNAAVIASGRLTDGTFADADITIQADSTSGSALSFTCPYAPLLDTLQQFGGPVAGGDFDLVNTSGSTCDFRFYPGQLGTDRTATVTFAVNYGNMAKPVYSLNRINEKSYCLVGGQGEASARAIYYQSSDWLTQSNKIELFADGRSLTTAAELGDRGTQKLQASKARASIRFDIIQTQALAYGRDYFLGDRVSWEFAGASGTVKILGVTGEALPNGGEQLRFELLDL